MRKIFGVLAVFLLSVGVAFGQADTAQLSGTVTDATGAVVPTAVIHLHDAATGTTRDGKTNAAGEYVLSGVPIGTYAVVITAPGFGSYNTTVGLSVGAFSTIDAKLGANAQQVITVEGGSVGVQVNTTSDEVSTIITPKEMMDLPSLSRNPYDFVSLSGNVATDPMGSTGRGVGAALNGQRSSGTEILMDGVENDDLYDATVGQNIPLDSVEEYSVIVNGFDAQFGRASGGVVNLATKAGTNKFHGSAYEYNRVSDLAANTYYEDSYDAFYGKAAGGTNLPHDHFTRNQFGYSIGGPAIHDKIFFFNNYEWNRIRSAGQNFFDIPTAAYLATTPANVQAFFASYGQLAAGTSVGPTVTVPGYTGADPLETVAITAATNAGAGTPVNALFGVSKVDFTLNRKISMYVRAATFKDANFPGAVSLSPYNGFNTTNTDLDQSYLFNLDYVATPNLLSSSKISYSRLKTEEPLGPAGIVPSLYLDANNTASVDPVTDDAIALPGYLPTSPGGAIPFGGPQNSYQFIEDVSWTKGKHTIKVGGEFNQTRDNRVFGAYENAVETASKNGTTLAQALTNLQSGKVYSFEVALNPQGHLPCSYAFDSDSSLSYTTTPDCSITLPAASPNFERQNTFNDGAAYAQDQWKVSSKLTLTAGLRWEYYGVQHNHNPNLESNFYLGAGTNEAQKIASGQVLTTPNSPTHGLIAKDFKNYAPRIGFAFDPKGDGKWAIRGGYGISYERNFGNVTYNVIQNPPNYAGVTLGSPTSTPALTLSNSNFGPFGAASGTIGLAPPSLRALAQNMPTAYTEQYSMTIEHEITRNDLVSIYYSGARGIHLYSIAGVNGIGYGDLIGNPQVNDDGGLPFYLDRINPQYGAINMREANGDSHYDSVNVGFTINNLSKFGLQFSANYTYAHALDNLSSTFSESGNNFNLGFLNPFNPSLDYGNADNDTRHRVGLGGIYEPTFLEFKSNKLLHTIAGGLEFAPIATLRTGTPFTIYDCSYGENACPRIVQAADIKYHGSTGGAEGPGAFDFLPIAPDSGNPFTNNLGFSDFPSTYGGYQNPGLERNQWFGPANVSFDMGVYKNFHFGSSDRYTVQIRGEFYDVLNHHNYYAVTGSADFAEVGNVNVLKGAVNSPGSGDERRNVQLAGRIQF